MAYLRWSTSVWYCYWLACDREHEVGPVLRVHPLGLYQHLDFNHRELRKDIDRCVSQCCKKRTTVSGQERSELRVAMREFLADVDKENEGE